MAKPIVKSTESVNKDGSLERNVKFVVEESKEGNFTCHWMNRLDQFGVTEMKLVITHPTIPEQRIRKNFRMAPEDITEAFLAGVAADEVERIVQVKADSEGGK